MIQFANEETAPLVRRMWKLCFEDSDEFMELYFSQKYRNENTLIYFEKGEAVASLQMLPYSITFYREVIPFSYLSGLCTLPEHRRKGYMDKLIHESHRIIRERDIPLAILVPAEDWLYGFYEKYEYVQIFEKDDNPIPLKQILDENADMGSAYRVFNNLYNSLDFCVQKNKDDFKAVVDDFKMEGCTTLKTNLSGMARVIDPLALLKLYARKNPQKAFRLKLNGYIYAIQEGSVELVNDTFYDIEADIALLCRLLFGFRINELDSIFHPYFSEHHPVMNLMLE